MVTLESQESLVPLWLIHFAVNLHLFISARFWNPIGCY